MRRVVSRCGLRGVRVGEASHPGPRRRRWVRSSSAESSWSGPDRALRDDSERDLLDLDVVRTVGEVDASSDNEPLMRPSSGRHVVPRRGEKEFNQVAEVGEPSAIDVGPRGIHVGPGHRGRLVVEVAPGVVDASAVALPDHVISDEESVDDEPMVSVGRVDRVTGAQPTVSNCEASQASASRVGRRLVIVSQDLLPKPPRTSSTM